MLGLPGILGTIINLLTVVLGFGLIVFFHELGHFLAARWAGIRVLTFAVGFGPPILSWRKGVGLRRGSSVKDYERLVREGRGAQSSPTEYRLSALPFGGYVQMLGQDDLDPGAVSAAPDSFQNAPVWKRMIVISAGVVMNILLAGVLFVVVFLAGLKVAPPVIGGVAPGSPAARAEPIGGDAEPGLRPGDTVLEINGKVPRRFDSIVIEAAMAASGRPMDVVVRRPGAPGPLRFRVTPEEDTSRGMLDLGVMPEISTRLIDPGHDEGRRVMLDILRRSGVEGVAPGDRIAAVNGEPIETRFEIDRAFAGSGGSPVTLTIEGGASIAVRPLAEMERGEVVGEQTGPIVIDHLLGLVPVIRVADSGDVRQGLEHGDVFRRIGSVEFPSIAEGINEIRAHKRDTIALAVLRAGKPVEIRAEVRKDGTVGFPADDTMRLDTLLSLTPPMIRVPGADRPAPPPAAGLIPRAGARIVRVAGRSVSDFDGIRSALFDATAGARSGGADVATVRVAYTFPYSSEDADAVYEADWVLDRSALDRLDSLGWLSPLPAWVFEQTETVLKADGPIDAVLMGLGETRRVMLNVYLTFLRLSQGSLAVQNIKGPVGIAHLGTLVADRGPIWLLFFLGMISVNLAVVNFLPLPIVDGGQFLFLLYEQIRGKPVPIPVQNAVMLAGMLLIVSVFLVVTFNDIRSLLGG